MSIVQSDPTSKTVGVAPKVAWPAVALFGIGLAAIVLHFILDDPSNILLEIGLTVIGSSGVVGVVGPAAPAAVQQPKLPEQQ